MYKLHDLKPNDGANRARKRVGRGTGGKGGKTAGRGTKGQKARNTVRLGFEGGQMPLYMRVPKRRGFNNPFRIEYQAINLDTLQEAGLSDVSPEALHDLGLVRKKALVKILGRGEITSAMNVKAHKFSKSAEAAITAAGGTVETLPLPWGDRRPPAKGNQFTNR
ncbi:50S ribosomal protein L15 [Actinospongicola halichondriae]|uniref:50S ribosomal protein L15 n=1 Tax=Actinospongicola halichondriae TaxID=3236844 RepID=UPI003D4F9EC7